MRLGSVRQWQGLGFGLTLVALVAVAPLAYTASCDGGSMNDHRVSPGKVDPVRWCYALHNGEPWSCYLTPDRPVGVGPVWVGPESEVRTATAKPCEYEDSNGCYWDAGTAGINGIGVSFYVNEDGHVYYERRR